MDSRLLEILVCPISKGPLRYDRQRQLLISQSSRLAYPVRDGIPIMLESEAIALSDLDTDEPASPLAPSQSGN